MLHLKLFVFQVEKVCNYRVFDRLFVIPYYFQGARVVQVLIAEAEVLNLLFDLFEFLCVVVIA